MEKVTYCYFDPSTQTNESGPTTENQASYHPQQEKATFGYFDPCTQTEERGPTAENQASYHPPQEKDTFIDLGPSTQTEETDHQLLGEQRLTDEHGHSKEIYSVMEDSQPHKDFISSEQVQEKTCIPVHPPQEKPTFSYFDPCTQAEERGPTA